MKRITAIHLDGTTNTSFNGAVGPIHFQNGVVELDTDEHDAYVAYCAVNVQFKVEQNVEAGPVDPASLKGKALDAALDEAGLSKDGKVDEKRARLAEHLATSSGDDPEDEGDKDADPSDPEDTPEG